MASLVGLRCSHSCTKCMCRLCEIFSKPPLLSLFGRVTFNSHYLTCIDNISSHRLFSQTRESCLYDSLIRKGGSVFCLPHCLFGDCVGAAFGVPESSLMNLHPQFCLRAVSCAMKRYALKKVQCELLRYPCNLSAVSSTKCPLHSRNTRAAARK